MAALFFWAQRLVVTNQLDPFSCPRCGAAYPMAGTCFGYGDEKHEPVKAVQR